jgi:hypothetical protein
MLFASGFACKLQRSIALKNPSGIGIHDAALDNGLG